jgi:N-acetylmuramoyl-L-alanine amidase
VTRSRSRTACSVAALVATAVLAACGSGRPTASGVADSSPPSVTSLPATSTPPPVTSTGRASAVPPTATPSSTTRKAPAAPVTTGSLAGLVIVIDPGHNGGNFSHTAQINRQVDAGFGQRKACNTTGTSTNGGYTEAAYTFDVARRLAAVLRGRGAKAVMTRTSNNGVGPCIDQRAAIGNAAHASAVLSIHGDGSLAAGARGFQIIVANRMVGGAAIQHDSQVLADDVRAAFRSGTGMPYSNYSGGGTAETHRSDIGGLNLSTRPAVMIETGNMRSATDAALMTSAAFRQREAVALAAGLARYLR